MSKRGHLGRCSASERLGSCHPVGSRGSKARPISRGGSTATTWSEIRSSCCGWLTYFALKELGGAGEGGLLCRLQVSQFPMVSLSLGVCIITDGWLR